ncbi:hypothetical protein ASPWEDRAFT_56962 [Aspergillus wentii DTO 134E9]|uniref:FAD-binding domain-containing protein n=1 Tax=Aspergillus wentii DTO 134E9 TaxID=1073089 RepID=A0A1L9RT81_ASPWE|nr:uncharacterized protein ASPWEDRAFT_56962 [Aspergillus wentii DTO 134E9]OJJ38125.1 hypothetical protein ASPWEDRAFT_56962 [Aspergillus wentii DTO 134E9]
MERYPSSGLDVLIVGGGLGGLTFAIEAHRKGHNVRILEKRPEFTGYGDVLLIECNALHTVKKWPGFYSRLQKISYKSDFHVKKYNGSWIGSWPFGDGANESLAFNRNELHEQLCSYVQELGIQLDLSINVEEYFETEEQGGVVLSDGQEITADLVIAADGVGSKSWSLVLGRKDAPISSGFACFRSTFPTSVAMANPIIAKEMEDFGDRISLHPGNGAHMVGEQSSEESWDKTGPADRALQYLEGWDPFLTEMVKVTPNNRSTDWRLMWRNPQPRWSSPHSRVVQLGDSAHSFLPTSGSGAAMAMEDAYSLASCLQLGGKSNLALAVRVHNLLRFERVSCTQKMGFHNRELFHHANWDEIACNPEIFSRVTGKWVKRHDPEEYVYSNYGRAANHLLTGAPFKNTNIPPGYQYKPWTVKELMDASDAGRPVVDEGDWS